MKDATYPDLKGEKHLNVAQRERYNELRKGTRQTLPKELVARLDLVKDYVGPLTCGEVCFEYERLLQDAFVVWVLAGEDPTKVVWQALTEPTVSLVNETTETTEPTRKKRWWQWW